MKRLYILFTFLASGLILSLNGQNISNVEATMENNKVVVNYSLTGGKFYNYYTISLYASVDGGKTFEGPLNEVSGDVGENIRRGDYTITWDAMKEMPVVDQGFMFDVRAEIFEDDMKKSVFIAYVGNIVTPIGLRIGMLGKVGWYAEFRASLSPSNTSSYSVKGGEFQDYDKEGYYEFNGTEGYAAYSGIVGVTYQVSRNFYFFGGVGYGKQEFLWQIDEFGYDNPNMIGQSYVKDEDASATGFELDIGGIIRINKFLITAGATTINFQLFNWTAGIGVAF